MSDMNDMNRNKPVPATTTPLAPWEDYGHRLTQALAQLLERQFLVLPIDGESPYVQFACGGVDGSRAEAWAPKVMFLVPGTKAQPLPKMLASLLALDWKQCKKGDKSPNAYLDCELPRQAPAMASLAVLTLRDVYRVTSPVDLIPKAFWSTGQEFGLPSLTLPRSPVWPASALPEIRAGLRKATSRPDLKIPDAGEIWLDIKSQPVHVEIHSDPPSIAIRSPAALGRAAMSDTARAIDTLRPSELGRGHLGLRLTHESGDTWIEAAVSEGAAAQAGQLAATFRAAVATACKVRAALKPKGPRGAVQDSRERFTGCLLAGAAGDALGAPVEFMQRQQILRRFGPGGIRDFAVAHGRIGAITDDTQMTLFTAEAMIRSWMRGRERGMCSVVDVAALAYQRWLHTQGEQSNHARWFRDWPGWLMGHAELHSRRAPGLTCLSALRKTESTSSEAINDSKGCGAVMRMAPVGLAGWRFDWSHGYTFGIGAALGRLTHGHPGGYLSAGALAVTVQRLVEGWDLREAAEEALFDLALHPHHEETLAALRQALLLSAAHRPGDPVPAALGEGWVGEEALAIGLYCALAASNLEEALIMAANIDGDSDSTASIAGNLAGARAGVSAIPGRWLALLELSEVIEELAGDLHDCTGWDLADSENGSRSPHAERRYAKYPPN